ncbi:MAG: ABC transporter permease [Calditrichaeota bacterium]|nr:MAG: ABC transporter permease [Calditrichota bacterium]
MNELNSFIKKEFRHILRDKRALLILFAMPVVLVILFGYAITNDIKDAKIAILDNAHDELSIGLTNKLVSSGYFIQEVSLHTNKELQEVFRDGKIKLAVVFPNRFAESYYHDNKVTIQLIADASDLNSAVALTNYASSIIQDYQKEIVKAPVQKPLFETTVKMLYNKELKGVYMFVPGVLALILMLIACMMTAVSLAREKETGTMRVITVSPLSPMTIIIGKVVPYLVISFIDTLIILVLSVFIFGMPIKGSFLLLFLVCLVFLFAATSLGIMISAFSSTQQIALIVSIVILFLPTILLSGFIYPIENMPLALQIVCQISPAKWFIEAIKSVMIKGTGFVDVWLQLTMLTVMIIIFVRVSIVRFRKTIA